MRTQVKPTKPPKARENEGDQVVSRFTFESDWCSEWREFFSDQLQSEVKQNRCNLGFLSTLNRKWYYSFVRFTHVMTIKVVMNPTIAFQAFPGLF